MSPHPTLSQRERENNSRLQLCAVVAALAISAWAEEVAAPVKPAATSIPKAAALPADTYKKGLGYLIGSQNKNGSWGSFESARSREVWLGTTASHSAFGDATTGLCVMSLIGPARENEDAARALDKGVRYLLDAPTVLRASGDTLYNTWTHIYVLEAMTAVLRETRLAALHEDARKTAARQIEALGKLQGAEGGFGYYDFSFASSHPTGSESCSFMTAAALLALDGAKSSGLHVADSMVNDALRSLNSLRLNDGAYMYGVYTTLAPRRLYNRVNGSLGRSQPCNLALLRYKSGGVTFDNLKSGLDNLFKNHHFIEMGKGRPMPHESWYATAGYYFFFGHYYAARVARELPPDEGRKYLDQLAGIMCRLQDADGSWWDFPLYGYYKAYGTAFALMTLEMAKP